MTESDRTEKLRTLYKTLTQQRQNLMYYLLGIGITSIGFVIVQTIALPFLNENLWKTCFGVFALILLGLSVCCGVFYLVESNNLSYLNYELLKGDEEIQGNEEVAKLQGRIKWCYNYAIIFLLSGLGIFLVYYTIVRSLLSYSVK